MANEMLRKELPQVRMSWWKESLSKMKIVITVDDRDLMGSLLPRWYGVAYRKFEVRLTVLAIIPLNLIIGSAFDIYRLFYRWLKNDGWKDKLGDAYWEGYKDGNISSDQQRERLAKRQRREDDSIHSA